MESKINRRDFIKTLGLGAAALAMPADKMRQYLCG